MGVPARFPSGVTNVPVTNPLGQYGLPDPALWHTYFEDFDYYAAGDWTVTLVGAGTQVRADVDGGAILLTNAAADDNSVFSQKVGEGFLVEVGKKLIFKARFKISDAVQSDFVMGLQITDATPLAVSDGIYFQKDDGDAFLDLSIAKASSVATVVAIASLVTDTFLEVAYAYDGKGELKYFVNGVQIGAAAVSGITPVTELTISFGVQNGEAVAKTMTVDYIFAAKER